MQAMKKCWKCGCEKPLEAFGRDARRHDGKNPKCKACVTARETLDLNRVWIEGQIHK